MSHVRLAEQAKRDIHDLWYYIAVDQTSPLTADRFVERLFDHLDLLATQPLMGELRSDLRQDLRVFSFASYAVLYYPLSDGIEVVGVVHGSRDIEAMFRHTKLP